MAKVEFSDYVNCKRKVVPNCSMSGVDFFHSMKYPLHLYYYPPTKVQEVLSVILFTAENPRNMFKLVY